MRRIVVGGEEIRNRREKHRDLVGIFLDLPYALEIADRIRMIFDADTEQRGERGTELRGQSVQCPDFYDFAAFDPINSGARDAELLGDFIGGQRALDAVGFETAADVAEPRRRASFLLSHN